MNFSFEEYMKLSETEKLNLKESLKSQLNTLNNFKQKEYELKRYKEKSEFQKEIFEKYKSYDIKMLMYENFTIHNYDYIFKPDYDKNKGIIALFTEQPLSQIEEYGLTELIIDNFKKHTNYDINLNIFKGKYNSYTDSISPIKYLEANKKDTDIFFVSELELNNIELKDGQVVYYLMYQSKFLGNKKNLLSKKQNIFISNKYVF